MSLTKDEIAETFYTAGLTTLGAVGVGYVSRKLNHNGYEKEMERHNKALEDLAKAKQAWTKKTKSQNSA